MEKKRSAARTDDDETNASSAPPRQPPPVQPATEAVRRDDDEHDGDDGLHNVTRCEVSQNEYFDACPHGMFRDPSLPPTALLDLLLRALEADDEQAADLNQCNYFLFSGPQEALWDAEFNARLAWEGFFTITSRTGPRRQIEPLPELQPFYGVLLWPNFEASKHVRKALARMARAPRNGYVLSNCVDPDRTWERLEAYHKVRHTSNWLTRRYFEMMKAASDDPTVNFTLHCVELTEAPQRAEGAADAASEEGATPTPRALPVVDGCRVRIEGVGGRADLNGSEGVASRYDSAAGWWVIESMAAAVRLPRRRRCTRRTRTDPRQAGTCAASRPSRTHRRRDWLLGRRRLHVPLRLQRRTEHPLRGHLPARAARPLAQAPRLRVLVARPLLQPRDGLQAPAWPSHLHARAVPRAPQAASRPVQAGCGRGADRR